MAKARSIVKRRKAIQNIRKITRTMELIATARFKKALDRATEADAYTRKISELVADLGSSDLEVTHPLLEQRTQVKNSLLLVLTSNRGLAGGYNANVLRLGYRKANETKDAGAQVRLEVAGKRGISYFRYRGLTPEVAYTQFEDKPEYLEIEPIAESYIGMFVRGEIDQLDVAYTQFVSASKQHAVLQTLLPMSASHVGDVGPSIRPSQRGHHDHDEATAKGPKSLYEFLPDAGSILAELVPTSFKVRLFKCFLDAAVSEQIARMVAMRSATDSADEMIKNLTRLYNRARQSQITRELSEIIGGAAALE